MRRLLRNRFFVLATISLIACSADNVLGQPQSFEALASSKFGSASRFWIAEPGDTSLNRWDPRELFEDVGVVLEWDSQNIVVVRSGAKRETTTPGDYVIRIEPSWANESGEKIHRLFSGRQYTPVVKEGSAVVNKATTSGLPRWQLRVILSEMVESCSALGKPHIAGTVFTSLAKENPPQLLLATIPIPWGEMAMSEVDLSKIQPLSEGWITQDSEALQLLGASWLLSGTRRSFAIETLEQLSKNAKSPLINAYARAQLWRTVPPAEILSDRYPKWLADRDKLLLPLQAGPTMLLAERLSQAGQPNLAIPEWLRIATMHGDRYHLAIKAIAKASEALRVAGRKEEADRVMLMLERYKIEKNRNEP